MPCWSIHLGVCKEVNKKLKLDNDLVLFGSILPDFLDRSYSHYYDGYLPDFDLFFNEYKDNINNPLIVGYYIHLLTDYFYNDFIYNKSFVYKDNKLIGIKLLNGDIIDSNDFHYCRRIKHDDFKNYGNYLIDNNGVEYPNDVDKIYKSVKELNIHMDKDIIKKRIDYFNKDDYLNYNSYNGYKLYDKKTYDKLYKDCINYVIDKINNIDL